MPGIIEDPPEEVPSEHRSLFYSTQLKYVQLADTLRTQGNRLTQPQLKAFTHQILNLFCMAQRIYQSLDADYLFKMGKNLCLGYNSIVVLLLDKINRLNQRMVLLQTRESTHQEAPESENSNYGLNNGDLPFTQLKMNKLGGIHLYNQNHTRGLEDQRILEQLKVEKEQRIRKKRQQLMETIIYQELNHTSQVQQPETTDELTKYILESKKKGSIYNYTPYEGELQEILAFFNNAQNEANDFLVRKAKSDPKTTQTNFSFADFQRDVQVQNAQVKRKILDKLKTFLSSFRLKQKQMEDYFNEKQSLLMELAELKNKKIAESAVQTEYDIQQLLRVSQNQKKELQFTLLALQHMKTSENESLQRENLLKYEISGKIKDVEKLEQQKKQLQEVVASLKKTIKVEKSKKSIALREDLSSRQFKMSGNGKSDHLLKVEEDRDLSSNSRSRKFNHQESNDQISILNSTKKMAKTFASNDWKTLEKDGALLSSKDIEEDGDRSALMYRTHQEKKKVVRYHIEPQHQQRNEHQFIEKLTSMAEYITQKVKGKDEESRKDRQQPIELKQEKIKQEKVDKNIQSNKDQVRSIEVQSQQQKTPSFTSFEGINNGKVPEQRSIIQKKSKVNGSRSKNVNKGKSVEQNKKGIVAVEKQKNEENNSKGIEPQLGSHESKEKQIDIHTQKKEQLENPNIQESIVHEKQEDSSGNCQISRTLEIVEEQGEEEREHWHESKEEQLPMRVSIPSCSEEFEWQLRERISLDLKQSKQQKNHLTQQLYYVQVHPTPQSSVLSSRRPSSDAYQPEQQQPQLPRHELPPYFSGFRDQTNLSPNHHDKSMNIKNEKLPLSRVKEVTEDKKTMMEKRQSLSNNNTDNQLGPLSLAISPKHFKQVSHEITKKLPRQENIIKQPKNTICLSQPNHRHSLDIPTRNCQLSPQPKQEDKIQLILSALPLSDGPADSPQNVMLSSLKSRLMVSYQSSKLSLNEIKNIIRVISLSSRKPTQEEESVQLAPVLSNNRLSLPSINVKIDPNIYQKKIHHGRFNSYCCMPQQFQNCHSIKDESEMEDLLQLSTLKNNFQSRFHEAHQGCQQGVICSHILKYVETVMRQIETQRHRQKPSMTLHIENIGKSMIEDAEIRAKIAKEDLNLSRQVNSGRVKTETGYVRQSLQKMKVIKMPVIRGQR